VTWAFRSANRRPCAEIADDPLPERRRIASAANDLAAAPPSWLAVERRATVEEVARDGRGFVVLLSGGRSIYPDAFAAFTGYRPDASYLRELAIESGTATEGSARLERALATVTDCLSVPCVAPGDLETNEPGFFFAGARSYGRSRTFLLRTGFAHLEAMLEGIAGASASGV
jgi:hypothetical protein